MSGFDAASQMTQSSVQLIGADGGGEAAKEEEVEEEEEDMGFDLFD